MSKDDKELEAEFFLLVGVHTIAWQNARWEVGELKVTQWRRWRWVGDVQQVYGSAREGYQCETFPATSSFQVTPLDQSQHLQKMTRVRSAEG